MNLIIIQKIYYPFYDKNEKSICVHSSCIMIYNLKCIITHGTTPFYIL